jgi:hypothetical protein
VFEAMQKKIVTMTVQVLQYSIAVVYVLEV